MNHLIKLAKDTIGGEQVPTVDARHLHKFLEVDTRFDTWIDRRIEEYGFEDGRDFCSILGKSRGGRPAREYHLTLDMAKELSMVERTDKGREARRYFIECERIARGQPIQDNADELSTTFDRIPLYIGVARIVVLRRLLFSSAYMNVNLRVGVLRFRDMTKGNVAVAAGFLRRIEAGNASPDDFTTIEQNRAQLLGPDSQLRLLGDQ